MGSGAPLHQAPRSALSTSTARPSLAAIRSYPRSAALRASVRRHRSQLAGFGRSDRSALREVEGSRLGSDARLSSGAERRPAKLETGQRLPEETRSSRMTVSLGSSEELSVVPRTPTSGVTWRLPSIHSRIAHLTWRRTTSHIRTGRGSDQRAALTAVI